MARQRDYQAEYQARTERAQERGFSGYGAQRGASREIAREFEGLRDRGIWSPEAPKVGTELHDLLLEAKAHLREYSAREIADANKDRRSLLPSELRDRLRAVLGYNDRDFATYYPTMRALY